MTERTITTRFCECSIDELPEESRQLIKTAISCTKRSYAPFSDFHVGAAALLADGTVVPGCNQENAAYSVTICAERSALFAAGAAHPNTPVVALAIAAGDAGGLTEEPISPCGTCRQAMVQTETRHKINMKVLLYGTRAVYVFNSAADLLPISFKL